MIHIRLVLKVYVLYHVTFCSSNVQHAVGLRKEHVDHIDIDNCKISESDSISLVECIILCSSIEECTGVMVNSSFSDKKSYKLLSLKCGDVSSLQLSGVPSLVSDQMYYAVLKELRCSKEKGYIFLTDIFLCIKIHNVHVNQSEANSTCYQEGGYLVKIENPMKQTYIQQFVADSGITGDPTIQGHRDKTTWKWMFDDGTEMTFFDWNTAHGQPNKGRRDIYLYLREQEQCKWHDVNSTVRPFICELQL